MAGKAPSRRKDKAHNSRPYDRPNQGILGKVASKVKDLLTPSWIFSVPSWIRAEEIDGSTPETEVNVEDLTENEEEEEEEETSVQVKPAASKPRLPIRPAKRPRYDNNVNIVTREPAAPFWIGPSTSQERTVVEVEEAEINPIIPSCDIRKTDAQVTINGDDHSENSDNSASTSGCSSLISSQDKPHRSSSLKLSESALKHLRGELKHKQMFSSPRQDLTLPTDMFSSSISRLAESRTTLWSCGTQTPTKSFPQRPSSSTRPSFNVSSFGRTTLVNNPSNLKIPSPFYEGNTTYGGASAYRKKSIAPYQINSSKSLKNQLKVKENTSSEGLEYMSSAARRILHTLERMSTPISDAKRMPNVAQSPSDLSLTIVPPSHRLKSYLSASNTSTASPKGPPIVNLSAVSRVPLLKNRNSKITRNSMMEIPIPPSSPAMLEGHITPVANEQVQKMSVQDTNSSPSPSAGGKMKTKRHSLHSSLPKNTEETLPDYDLPHVPFPMKNVPVLNLDTQTIPKSISSGFVGKKVDNSKSEEPQFTFSSPIEYPIPQVSLHVPKTTVTSTSSFEFSPPIVVTSTGKSVLRATLTEPPRNEGIVLNRSVDDILKNMRDRSSPKERKEKGGEKKNTDVSSTKNNVMASTKVPAFNSDFGEMFKPKPGTWTCNACLLQNEDDSDKCVACETAREVKVKSAGQMSTTSTKPFSDDSLKVDHEPGSWACGTCRIRHKSIVLKCSGCETPRPASTTQTTLGTGFGDKFAVAAGTWECPTCMIRNVASVKKCIACQTPIPSQKDKKSSDGSLKVQHEPGSCETPRPASTTPTTLGTGFGDKFKVAAGSWECSGCMLRNVASAKKCIACEALNPSQKDNDAPEKDVKKNADSKMPGVSAFGGKLFQSTSDTWICDTCFVKNTLSSTKCIACETLKPSKGQTSSDAKFGFKFGASTQNSSSSFTFGSLVSTSVPTSVTPTFKFGVPDTTSKPTSKATVTEAGFTFGVPSQTSKTATSEPSFQFGVPSPASKATTVESNFKFGIPSQTSETTVKPMTIFGSQDSKIPSSSSDKKESDSMKSAEIFKFGAQATPTSTSEEKDITPTPSSTLFAGSKGVVFPNLSADSAGLNLLNSAAKTTASPTGFKFGATPVANSDAMKTRPEESKPANFVAPASIFGGNTSTIHSTTVSEKLQQTSTNTLANTLSGQPLPSAVLSTVKPSAPFTFGAPTSTVASSVSLSGNSHVSTFGQFNDNISKSQEIPLFKMIDNKSAITGSSSESAKTSIPSSGITPSCFNSPLPAYNAFGAAATLKDKTKLTSSTETSQQTAVNTLASAMPVAFTSSTFVFGNPNTIASTAGSTFAFGAPVQTTQSLVTPAPVTNPSTFQFSATSSTNDSKPGFTFKPSSEDKKPSLFPNPNVSAFGATNPPASSIPFKFGATSQQTPAGNFGFSALKPDSVPAPGKFSFGAAPTTTPAAFTAFQPSQSTTTAASIQSFNFGNSAPNSSSAFKPATKFTFGTKATEPAAPASNPINPSANPPSVFGAPAVQHSVFGANTSSPAFGSPATPAFGNLSAVPKLPEPAGGFNFVATSAPTATQSPFVFGAPAEKKSTMGATQSPGFNFMAPQAPQGEANSGFSTGFNMSTPPSFNFGATSTPTNQPFQFAAVVEGSGPATAAGTGARKIRRAVRRGIRKE